MLYEVITDQPVGAGDRHAAILQRADDRLEQRSALAHQHQHVAGAPSGSHPAADRVGDPPRQLDLRTGLGDRVERGIPRFDLMPVVGLRQRPDLA